MTELNDIPVSIIYGAKKGEYEAITYILSHYSGYINKLSTRTVYNQNGEYSSYIDEDMRTRLEAKLICSIINDFKILPK